MGVQSLQDYISSDGSNVIPLTKYLGNAKLNTSNLVLVHADSCFRYFYHENMDWICGGQWSELFQCVEKFVKAFRSTDLELVIFLDGGYSEFSLYQWLAKQRQYRDVVKQTLSHVTENQTIPFRTKSKSFVAPGAFKAALRLAFRACEVTVCNSLEDVYKESILYAKDENCLGILGNDAHYFLYNVPRYLTFGNTKWFKKALNACKVFNREKIMKELSLTVEDLPYFGALLGNFVLNDNLLGAFYWDIIEDDSPLKKVKDNLTSPDAALPPSDVRLKCVAKFVNQKRSDLKDFPTFSRFVFGNSSTVSVDAGIEKLKKIVSFYQESLNAAISAVSTNKDEINHLSASGFPLLTGSLTMSGCKSKYNKTWKFDERSKKTSEVKKETAKEKLTSEKHTENPENVLKQGTLEEAAQALEELELKETVTKHENGDVNKVGLEEKPSALAEDEEKAAEMIQINVEQPEVLVTYPREIHISSVYPDINNEVLAVAQKRHQSGQMCPEILSLLTKGEVMLNLTVEDEDASTRCPIVLIYRPLRQLMYGVLFGAKQEDSKSDNKDKNATKDSNDNVTEPVEVLELSEKENQIETVDKNENEDKEGLISIKEWCVYNNKDIVQPEVVKPIGMNWVVPSLKQLWFGTNPEDNANRLKAFLSCMKSDTINMSNTSMVPQRLMLLCCVLRYLVQQDNGKSILTKQDIDAFLAQALSSHLTTEHNAQNLANLKLNQVDARCIQLASTFMSGIENAITANDACGSPVPWEFCCPWNFFDGKLFHTKWLQATMNFSIIDLCDGKSHIAEKLERLRWCVTEGLEAKYTIAGLKENKASFNPFGNVPTSLQSRPMHGVMRPDGSYLSQGNSRTRSRGPNSRRQVHGSGGTLHVAGVPVAHWGGNKAGIGYTKNGPGLVVGGVNSIDLPSSHQWNRNRGGRGNRGRGLLDTPYISPWQQGFGYEFLNSTCEQYMKGVQKVEQVRSKFGRTKQPKVYSNVNRNPRQQERQQQQQQPNKNNMWLGKGRGQEPSPVSPVKPVSNQRHGRGQWLTASE